MENLKLNSRSASASTFIFIFFIFYLFKNCFAIYEDQAGINDWHQKYLGRVTRLKFLTFGQRKRFLVATEKNVLASLHLRTGQISWRNVLGDGNSIVEMEASGKHVFTVSFNNIIRSFSINDGILIWEKSFPPLSSSLHLILAPSSPSDKRVQQDLILYNNEYIFKLNSLNGDVVWKSNTPISKILFDSKKKLISIQHVKNKNMFKIFEIDIVTGQFILKNEIIQEDTPFSQFTFSKNSIFTKMDNGLSKNIFYVHIDDENLQFRPIDIQTKLNNYLKVNDDVGYDMMMHRELRLVDIDVRNGFLLSSGNDFCLFLKKSDEYDVATCVKDVSAFSDVIKLDEDKYVDIEDVDDDYCIGFISQKNEQSILFKSVVFNKKVVQVEEERFDISNERGKVSSIFMNSYYRKGLSNYGFRAVIVTEDDSLSLLQQEKVVWNREEALASITEVKFVDLPVGRSEEISVSSIEHSLEEWIKMHWIRAKSSLTIATVDEKEKLKQIRLQNPSIISPYRDHNGFRKLIIAFTTRGKILAIHSGDGRIMWSKFTRIGFNDSDAIAIHIWKNPHKKILESSPEILVIDKGGGKGQNSMRQSQYLGLNAHTGDITLSSGASFSVRLTVALPFLDSDERKMILLVGYGHRPRVRIFPTNEEVTSVLKEKISKIFFYIVDDDDNSITGYGIEEERAEEGEKEVNDGDEDRHGFRAYELWKISFSKETERIVSTASRRLDESVYTSAKTFSNRSMTFKVLSKNVLFVVTGSPENFLNSNRISPEKISLNAYLIHTLSGKILVRNSHPGMGTPVHAVFSENWILYHYFDYFYHRHQFTVWELYDDSMHVSGGDAARYIFGLSPNFTNQAVASWNPPKPKVLRQSYFFPTSIKFLTVTNTLNGITNKQILIATLSNQLLAMDKRFFDPRRSLQPSPQDKEDGIVPYSDTFSIDGKSYLTHSLQVEGLRGVVSEPSRLESTTLIFCFGIDLFYLRTTPSKMYDSLSEDFSYVLLLITIVALLLGIFVTWVLSKRASLLKKWK